MTLSRWSSFSRTCLEGTIPHLEFSIEIQSNHLTYQGNPYTEYQQFLYTLIKCLKNIEFLFDKFIIQMKRHNTHHKY